MLPTTRIEVDAPVERLYALALREGNAKKPVYEMHKWWARRLGSVFRMVLLLATAPPDQPDEELWRRFYAGDDLSRFRLLDMFMGGGTSIVEGTKLGFQTAGVDIDPVAWFVTRQEVRPGDPARLAQVLAQLQTSDLAAQVKALYQTLTPAPEGPAAPAPEETAAGGRRPLAPTADVIYNFWVDILTCPACQATFEAHPHYRIRTAPQRAEQTVFCRACHTPAVLPNDALVLCCAACTAETPVAQGPVTWGNYTCLECGHQGRVVDLPGPGQPLPKRWFAIEYLEPGTGRRRIKAPDADDLAGYVRAEQLLAAQAARLPLPRRLIPLEGRNDPRPTTHGYATYQQLFNARQLLALGWILEWIRDQADPAARDDLVLAFSDALAANNLLCSFAIGYDKLTPLFGLHAYNMITRPVENNVWGTAFGRGSFLRCVNKVLLGKQYGAAPYESRYRPGSGSLEKVYGPTPIAAEVVTTPDAWYAAPAGAPPRCLLLNQPAQQLTGLRDRSIQIILSDPPYYNNLSYSELSDFYYAWIQPFLAQAGAAWTAPTTPYAEALFVGQRATPQQNIATFTAGLRAVFGECARVLDDPGLLIFTFHHLDAMAWVPLADALLTAGFVVTKVFPVRSEGHGAFHSTEGTVKWDAVLVCRHRPEAAAVAPPETVEEIGTALLRVAWGRYRTGGVAWTPPLSHSPGRTHSA